MIELLKERGGNHFFYLGAPVNFIDKFQNPLRQRLIGVRDQCEAVFFNHDITPRSLQRTQGIRVDHKVKKELLLSLIPILKSYPQQYSYLYHNVNLCTNEST